MLPLLETRRSIRKYRDEAVPPALADRVLEAMLRAPSAKNGRPWTFVAVDDRDLLRALARCKPTGAAFLAEARLAVVVAADPARSDVWVEDCAIAATLGMMEAHAAGLGTCWVQVRGRSHDGERTASAFVRDLLALPEGLEVDCILSLGWPAEEKAGWAAERLPREAIRRNRG